MARFNLRNELGNVKNQEGAPAFNLAPEMALYNTVCTSLLQPQYYKPNTEVQLNELRNIIRNNNPMFVAKLAVYARTKMHLRTIPLVLLVELARNYSHAPILKKAVAATINRPDEMLEILAYYLKANDRTDLNRLSWQLRKGIKMAANKFDEYQYAKWNRQGGPLTLKDVITKLRPMPKDANQSEIFSKVVTDSLAVPYTWETEFCKLGRKVNAELVEEIRHNFPFDLHTTSNKLDDVLKEIKDVYPGHYQSLVEHCNAVKQTAKQNTWEVLVDSKRMGYQATLMNIRNLLQNDVDMASIKKVANYLSNPENVAKSKMFPFRFLSAYRALVGQPRGRWYDSRKRNTNDNFNQDKVNVLANALNRAAEASIDNVSLFDNQEPVLIACDVSSSMWHPISGKSTIMNYDVGLLMGLLLKKKYSECTIGIFGDHWKVKDGIEAPGALDGLSQLYRNEGEVGYSTHGYKVLEWAIETAVRTGKKYHRIMMFTDCQMYNEDRYNNTIPALWKRYKKLVPDAKLYLFNLAPYREMPLEVGKDDVYLISGWSNEIFNVLKNLEDGKDALDAINEISL